MGADEARDRAGRTQLTVFVDSAIPMYAAGADHRLREPCRHVLRLVEDGRIPGVTSTEVVQEIFHRYVSLGHRGIALMVARTTLDLFAPAIPVTHAVMNRMTDLVERYEMLSARDLVHVATCAEAGIDRILSSDRGFDSVTGLHRIDPCDTRAVDRLAR